MRFPRACKIVSQARGPSRNLRTIRKRRSAAIATSLENESRARFKTTAAQASKLPAYPLTNSQTRTEREATTSSQHNEPKPSPNTTPKPKEPAHYSRRKAHNVPSKLTAANKITNSISTQTDLTLSDDHERVIKTVQSKDLDAVNFDAVLRNYELFLDYSHTQYCQRFDNNLFYPFMNNNNHMGHHSLFPGYYANQQAQNNWSSNMTNTSSLYWSFDKNNKNRKMQEQLKDQNILDMFNNGNKISTTTGSKIKVEEITDNEPRQE